MEIKQISATNCLDLLPIFVELEQYYFGDEAASEAELVEYLTQRVFSEYSGVKVVAIYDESAVLGFATYTIMYPAPRLSGQMYMKDLFVSAQARRRSVGVKIMKHLASIACRSGCQRLDWTAETTNPVAGQFYLSIGANLIKEKEYYRFEGQNLIDFASFP